MKNKYNCVSVVNLTKTILIVLLVILPNLTSAQQSPSIQTGVTFQWSDEQTNGNLNLPATIQSVTIDNVVYNTFVVPTSYEMTRLGPEGDSPNRIRKNGVFEGGDSSEANWNANAINAFQDKNLNHYFTANPNGRSICSNFDKALTTDAQKQTIFYNPAIPSNEGGVIAVTERGGNNCFYIEAWGIPLGGGPEQKLGETFVRQVGDYRGCDFGVPASGSDYWKSGRCNENGQTIGIGLFFLDDIAPTGSKITKIEFIGASRDHGDGKFFILQKYAVDQENTNCIDNNYDGDLNVNNTLPEGSTFSILSGPTPAGQSFTLNSDGTYTYVPEVGYSGNVEFQFEACLPFPNNTVCDSATVNINFAPLPFLPEVEISCTSTNNFVITATSPLGSEFEYSLNNGPFQTEPEFTNLTEGDYILTVRNIFTQCESIAPATPIVLDNLELTGNVTDILCGNNQSGAIDISVSGGAPPYTYSWSNGATTEDLSGISAGTYTILITDTNACNIVSGDFTVSESNDVVEASITSLTNTDCNGNSSGSFTVEASGGTSPYNYSLDGGATTQTNGLFENLAAGIYQVLIIDANNCTIDIDATIGTDNNENPDITVPTTLIIEGCSESNITNLSALFPYSVTQSGDVQSTFASNTDYNVSNNVTVQSITYIDVITSTNNCPITVLRTFTVTDTCDNTATAIQTITVQDTLAPTLSVPADVTIECTEDETSDNTGEATGTDNCSIVTITQSSTETEDCGNTKTITRTWTATDECGNSTSGSQTITVVDTTPPIIIDPANVVCTTETINGSFEGNPFTQRWKPFPENEVPGWNTTQSHNSIEFQRSGQINGNLSHSGNYHLELNGKGLDDIYQEFCSPSLGELEITFFHKKRLNNTILNILELYAGSDVNNLTLIGTYEVDYAAGWKENTVTYNVPENQISTVVLFKAIQGSTNSIGNLLDDISVTSSADIDDSLPQDITVECNEIPDPVTLTAMDTCGDATITFEESITSGSCDNEYLILRTWTATDSCNNETTYSQTVTVVDTTPPTFTVPENLTLDCDADVTDLTITGDVTDESDNCSIDLEATYTDSTVTGSCANETIISRTWTLVDACGNQTTLVQTINLIDTTAPTFTVPADTTIECDVDVNDLTITGDVTDETDNCTLDLEATYTDVVTLGDCENASIITRTWSLTDGCDNTTTLTQIINVVDTTVPTFTVPNNITINCDDDLSDLTLTGDVIDEADNCSINLQATYVDSITDGNCVNEFVVSRTWTLTDTCDNTTTFIQTINIVDTVAPTFTVPADVTVDCNVDVNDLAITGDVTDELDNCTTDLDATYSDNIIDGDCANTYKIDRTWTLTDTCDNTTILIQTISVRDETPPTFTVPLDITVECDVDVTDLTITGNITDENDNCSTDLEASFKDTLVAGDCANESLITRTWTLADACGNSSVLIQTITVKDSTPPVFDEELATDITVECDAIPAIETITATDNCGNATVTVEESIIEGSCNNQYTLIRKWKAVDNCGNETIQTQTINVEDNAAPSFNEDLPADATIECDAVPEAEVLTASDNCGSADVEFEEIITPGSCENSYTIERTWTATDSCNNQSIHTQTVTIVDTTPPTFSVPEDITLDCNADVTDLVITGDVTDESDNCSADLEATYSDSVEEGTCPGALIIKRTWSLTDTCDNTTTFIQTINVKDETAPTFTVPNDIIIECDVDVTDLTLTGDVTDKLDNCSTELDATYTDSITDGDCLYSFVISRTWSLADECDNTTVLIQTITVQDSTPPVFDEELSTDITVECDAIPGTDTVTATDNCGEATVTVEESITDGSCENQYTLIRKWKAVDNCGNETLKTQTINVEDNSAPSFNEDLPADATLECDAVPEAEALTASDNCGSADVEFEEIITNGGCAGDFIIERTWTATDICGNDTIHTQILTVEDNTAPTVSPTTPFDENVTVSCDAIPERPDLVFEDACINGSNPNPITVEFNEDDSAINEFEDYVIIRTWNVTDDCGNLAVFTQTITVEISNVIDAPDANRCILDTEFDLFDLLLGDFDTGGTWSVIAGNATVDGSLFDPSSVEVGDYIFKYEITESECPTEVEVNLEVDDECVVFPCGSEDVIISKTVTANGDNFNEFFTISGVDECGFVIELQIFNRWGAEIYKSSNYQNDWNGEAHGSSAGNSGKVPTGTYYYIINLRNSGLEPFAGPIYVATNK